MSGDSIKGERPNKPKTSDPDFTDAGETVGWCDAVYGADKWFGLSHVPPVEAALLLCGFNPHDSDSTDSALAAAICQTTSDTIPADLKAVGADPILSHRADSILSQGWKPTLRLPAVDKCRSLPVSSVSSMVC